MTENDRLKIERQLKNKNIKTNIITKYDDDIIKSNKTVLNIYFVILFRNRQWLCNKINCFYTL